LNFGQQKARPWARAQQPAMPVIGFIKTGMRLSVGSPG
jgi:hypothetical protein